MIYESGCRTTTDCGTEVEIEFKMTFTGPDRTSILNAITNNKLTDVITTGLKSYKEVKE